MWIPYRLVFPANARHELWPRRSRGLARYEDNACWRRASEYKVIADPGRALEPFRSKIYGTTASAAWSTPAPPTASSLSMDRSATSPISKAAKFNFATRFLQGCAGAWSLHPNQVEIAKRVFSPDPAEVAFAKKILDVMPDGSGVGMVDGKMQDDATWKQAKVMVDLAKLVAAKDPARKSLYNL